MGVMEVMQISSFRGSEEPKVITRNSDERFAEVTHVGHLYQKTVISVCTSQT